MVDRRFKRELTLDLPGCANPGNLRACLSFTLILLATAIPPLLFGATPLRPAPQFASIHATFLFVVDVLTSFLLFGQFRYRRVACYAGLGAAYLFSGLVMVPFLLSFPMVVPAPAEIIGGSQSAFWCWRLWHLGFPLMAAVALSPRMAARRIPAARIGVFAAAAVAVALVLALAVAVAVTRFADLLPALRRDADGAPTALFYQVGAAIVATTAVAAGLAWWTGLRRRTVLHLWLAATLTALLIDGVAGLASDIRFSVAWYFGRIESMLAAGVLLAVLLGSVHKVYRRLAATVEQLWAANGRLTRLNKEKDKLVASLQKSEEQVRHLAYYDALTGLPNRRLLLDRLNQALARARRHHYPMAIMFLDLDRFKEVNDSLGHEAGDALLKEVATRLLGCLRTADTASRTGGDEFVVVLPEIAHPRDAGVVAGRIIGALAEPVPVGGQQLKVTTSIGIALYPIDGHDDMDALMKKADEAMYVAKQLGRNRFQFYSDDGIVAAD